MSGTWVRDYQEHLRCPQGHDKLPKIPGFKEGRVRSLSLPLDVEGSRQLLGCLAAAGQLCK